MNKNLILLFDSIRDPRDIAEVIYLGLALDIEIDLTGSSLYPEHPKVINIINSWIPNFIDNKKLEHVSVHHDFSKRISVLKKQGYFLIGTSSNTNKSSSNTGKSFSKIVKNLSEFDLSKGKHVIVFGTETSGLSNEKVELMDEMLCVPMKNGTSFFTIRAIAPVFAFEALRQKKMV